MGISIKNEEVEALLRQLAEARGLSLTNAMKEALELALAQTPSPATKRQREAAWKHFIETAKKSKLKSKSKWTRDDAYDR
jgi:hypothetical protein